VPSTSFRRSEADRRAAMIDAWGRRPLCTHEADGRWLAAYVVSAGRVPWDVVETMRCEDVHLLAQSLMRSQYLADADRRLLELDGVSAPALRPFTPSSLRVAYVLGGLTLLTLLGFCGFIVGLIR
jgi:hypothetical protein